MLSAKPISEVVKNNGSYTLMHSDTNSCAVKALSAAFGVSYDEAYEFAKKEWNRQHGKGTKTCELVKSFNSGEVLGRKVTAIDTAKMSTKTYTDWMGRERNYYKRNYMTLNVLAKMYPNDTLYVIVNGHALVIDKGNILDYTFAKCRRAKKAWLLEKQNISL